MDTGLRYDPTMGSGLNRHAISFQSNATDSTSEMIMMEDYYQINNKATTSTRSLGNPVIANNHSGFIPSMNPSDSALRLKHVAGLAVEWSVEEQHKLDEGLSKFANEPTFMRYIKVAATLRDKTVRDVALRCRWMSRKRKKPDEPHTARKLKDKKDNMVVSSPSSSSKPSIPSVRTLSVTPLSVNMNNHVQIDSVTFEALSGSIKHLLEQNNQVLGQISANISLMKLQDNFDLFSHTKNNITAILNDMRYMPGPPFPVTLNEDLARSILSSRNQRMMFEAPSGMYMKQEPEF